MDSEPQSSADLDPLAPMASLGSVHMVSDDNVAMLETKALDVIGCVFLWGLGS